MILTVDIGNTNITLGGFEDDKLCFTSSFDTRVSRTEDQYAVMIKDALELHGVLPDSVTGCAVSSVVPPVTDRLERGIEKICGVKALTVSPDINVGLEIKLYDPSQLGGDLLCAAVAAKEKFPLPCVFADIDTCLKIGVLDANGAMLGGALAPGISMSFEALSKGTAMLPLIDAQPTASVIGKDTLECMRSGVITGMACMIDGLIERYEEILGEKITLVVTGDFSGYVAPLCRREITVFDHLVLEGLYIIYQKAAPVLDAQKKEK